MLICHAYHRALEKAAMAHRHILNLIWKHLETRDRNHVLLAVNDTYAALDIHDTDIAGTEKSVCGHCLCGFLRPIPIASHDLRPARTDFALFPVRQLLAVVVADRNFRRGYRQSDRSGPLSDVAA